MPLNTADNAVYRRDVATKGQTLTAQGRADLLDPYLPPTQDEQRMLRAMKKSPSKGRRRRVRPFLAQKLHFVVYFLIQCIYGIIVRFIQFYHACVHRTIAVLHYHHRTPEYIQRDLKELSRIPQHLSVILRFKPEEDGALEKLMDETAELCAWSAAAGIPLLSVYEKSGIMKSYMSALQELVEQKLTSYFGPESGRPTLRLFAPNLAPMASSPMLRPQSQNGNGNGTHETSRPHLDLLLLSASDGRDTLVDLTRTLTEMAQSKKIQPKDITSDLINAEIMATTTIPGTEANGNTGSEDSPPSEPDLVIIFGPYVKLDGYPPWQIRLSEIFCVGGDVKNGSTRVEYQGFLRGLWRYAGAEMRFGR
jgi:dehydrodolichyl diphosphate syntase complex subunit NUS1